MERPILFSGPMVRAILEGRKTMTRRVINPQRPEWELVAKSIDPILSCPYGQPGDLLWVRETWAEYADPTHEYRVYYAADDDCGALVRWRPSIHMFRRASRITLEITDIRVELLQAISEEDARAEGVEAVKDNSPFCGPDAWKDYQDDSSMPFDHARGSFRSLWDSINGKRGYGWNANPWVWVVSFKVVKP